MYYSNGFKNTYEELITFYPVYYRDVLEMRAILEAQGRIGDNCITAINGVLENCFVQSADAEMIARLEKFLKIEAEQGSSLEERRRIVYSYFLGFGKMSASKLKETIRAFTGAESTIKFERTDEAGNNTLIITIERGNYAGINYSDIENAISKRLPAHLAYQIRFNCHKSAVIVKSAESTYYIGDYNACGDYLLCGTYPESAYSPGDTPISESSILGEAVLGEMVLGN